MLQQFNLPIIVYTIVLFVGKIIIAIPNDENIMLHRFYFGLWNIVGSICIPNYRTLSYGPKFFNNLSNTFYSEELPSNGTPDLICYNILELL